MDGYLLESRHGNSDTGGITGGPSGELASLMKNDYMDVFIGGLLRDQEPNRE